jgi:hypothetical protein
MAEPEDMEKLKAEWAQAARAGRLSSVKGFFVAVSSDSVSAIAMVASLVVGCVLTYYATDIFHGVFGIVMPRGVTSIVMIFTLALPLSMGLRFVSWWRDKTGRG